ncbi:MAG: hypothetical protein JWM64_1298 [Frankiales bacterium]|nr:hypothetical protein [Frankiales bacterium]
MTSPSTGAARDGGEPTPSARDLVRRRSRTYAAPDTGRMHHIGAAPAAVPVHTDDGVGVARTTSWQLADRTVGQLQRQRDDTAGAMARAAADLDFEQAARLRDELAAVEQELARR